MPKVIVAEPEPLVRGAIVALLQLEPDIDVVADTDRSDDVVELAGRAHARVAVIDYHLPSLTGAGVARQLAAALPSCRSLILASDGSPGQLNRSVEAGASGFLAKNTRAAQLSEAIRRVAAGEQFIDPAVAAGTILGVRSPLTSREAEIFRLVATGASVAGIARQLYVTAGTVRNHISSVITKLGAHSRLDAVRIVSQHGWL